MLAIWLVHVYELPLKKDYPPSLCAPSTNGYVSYPKQLKIAIYLCPSTRNDKDIAGKII